MAKRSRLSVWVPRALFAVLACALVIAVVRMHSTIGRAFQALLALPGVTVAAVLGVFAAMVLSRALLYRWSLPRSTLARGVLLDQVKLAVGNSVPGGGVVGGALCFRIGRSFRHTPDEIAVSLLAVGEAMSIARWTLVVVILGASVAFGAGSGFDVAVLGYAAATVVSSAVLWWAISRDTRGTRWAMCRAQAVIDRVARRVPRLGPVAVEPFVLGMRSGASWVLSARAGRLLLAATAATLGGAAIVVLVTQAVGGDQAPPAFDVIRVYLLARFAAGFSPTPGGVGVIEGALGGGLVAAGADPASAVAAILVYRGLTFALPIATGSAAFLLWRRWDSRRQGHEMAVGGHPSSRSLVFPSLDPGAAGPALAVVSAGSIGQTAAYGAGAGRR